MLATLWPLRDPAQGARASSDGVLLGLDQTARATRDGDGDRGIDLVALARAETAQTDTWKPRERGGEPEEVAVCRGRSVLSSVRDARYPGALEGSYVASMVGATSLDNEGMEDRLEDSEGPA